MGLTEGGRGAAGGGGGIRSAASSIGRGSSMSCGGDPPQLTRIQHFNTKF